MFYKGDYCTECGKKLTKAQKNHGLNVCSGQCEKKFEKWFNKKEKYTKKLFGSDLFFFLGFLRGAIRQHNKEEKQKVNFERFEQFEKYCFKRFAKKGKITG